MLDFLYFLSKRDFRSYGGSSNEGSLTPYIHELFAENVEKCILDGEMVGYNPLAGCIGLFFQNFCQKVLIILHRFVSFCWEGVFIRIRYQ